MIRPFLKQLEILAHPREFAMTPGVMLSGRGPDLVETTLVCWAYQLAYATVLIVLYTYSQGELSVLSIGGGFKTAAAVYVFYTGVSVILFPLKLLAFFVPWELCFRPIYSWFGIHDGDAKIRAVLVMSQAGHPFLAIPFIGPWIQSMVEWVYMVLGVKWTLQVNLFAALAVCVLPGLCLMLFAGLLGLSGMFFLQLVASSF